MSGGAGAWLLDTLIYSGVLIALVLALRGAVSRTFGPQVAYALWALPLIRLVMPPLVLPASMAPVAVPAKGASLVLDAGQAAVPVAMPVGGVDIGLVLLAVWLAGALALLGWRTGQYRAMRRAILAGARPVGEAGKVRLVETPATALPLAFGIADKVVALPPGFMAMGDVPARDLAIAHELAHHRGHDLLANLAAQLVLAVHWFNPLAWLGWQAMRKDQEAACDARVVAGRERAERATYAEVIAGFAAGRPLALHAPLACPMLGEKSIIHRLRSLTMAETSLARRRIGLGVLAAGALALPLTASISYAQPEAPAAPRLERRMVIVDAPAGANVDDPSLHSQEVRRADGSVVTLRTPQPVSPDEALARVDAALATMPEPPEPPAPPAPGEVRRFELRRVEGPSSAQVPAPPAPPAPPPAPGQRSERRFMLLDQTGDPATVDVRTLCEGAGEDAVCTVNVTGQTIAALERARDVVRSSGSIPEATRSEVLRELEREIAAMREGAESSYAAPLAPQGGAMMRVSWRMVAAKPRAAAAAATDKPALAPARVVKAGARLCPEEACTFANAAG